MGKKNLRSNYPLQDKLDLGQHHPPPTEKKKPSPNNKIKIQIKNYTSKNFSDLSDI